MKNVVKILKKNCIIVETVILIIVLVVSFFISGIKGVENKKPTDSNILREITVDKYIQLLSEDEASIIYVGSPSCPHCEKAKPVLMEIANEYNIVINHLDASKFNQNNLTTFNNSHIDFKEGKWGVPLIMIVKDNQIIDKTAGFPQNNGKDIYLNFFNKNNVINKK